MSSESGSGSNRFEALRRERWRLVLGKPATNALGRPSAGDARSMDAVLETLYGEAEQSGGLGDSAPEAAHWLRDVRRHFPQRVASILQQDAVERLDLRNLLVDPEFLEEIEPDVHLAAHLLLLAQTLPQQAKESARKLVRQVTDELEERLRLPLEQAVRGSLSRIARTRRPRAGEIDWQRTIRKNLKHWIPERGTLIAEEIVGYGRERSRLRDVVLCVDQSGSMASSAVYAGLFASVLASIRALRTRLVAFDTEVVDLSEMLSDPVDLLFAARLGGGTDIARALAYCSGVIERPSQTILILISDLYEGGDAEAMLRRTRRLSARGVQVICLLALSDAGVPSYDANLAARLGELGVPTFGCTPDLFPDLMAAALREQDVAAWAAERGLL